MPDEDWDKLWAEDGEEYEGWDGIIGQMLGRRRRRRQGRLRRMGRLSRLSWKQRLCHGWRGQMRRGLCPQQNVLSVW
jgi:hypothetical protein